MKKNLLIITNCFPDVTTNRYNCNFVYDYANLVKDDFEKIYVFSPQSHIPKLIENFLIIKNFKHQINFQDYKINNMVVHYPRIKLFPFTIIFPWIKEYLMKKALCSFIKDKEISLVHCHFIYPAGYLGITAKNKLNSPLVITSHEGDINEYLSSSALIKKRSSQIFGAADKIIAVSSSTKDAIVNFCPDASQKTMVINNFTNTDLFKVSDKSSAKIKLGFKASDRIIINVANLIVDKKGQLDAVEVIDKLINKIPDVKLILIGTGPDKSIIQERINSKSLQKSIQLIGAIKNQNLPDWYNAADIFLFPSYYESFGISQIEAAACNVPVVAYDNDGSIEVAQKGIGRLVKLGDVNNLVKEVEKILKSKNKFDYRDIVVKKFSKESIYEKIHTIYTDLLKDA